MWIIFAGFLKDITMLRRENTGKGNLRHTNDKVGKFERNRGAVLASLPDFLIAM